MKESIEITFVKKKKRRQTGLIQIHDTPAWQGHKWVS